VDLWNLPTGMPSRRMRHYNLRCLLLYRYLGRRGGVMSYVMAGDSKVRFVAVLHGSWHRNLIRDVKAVSVQLILVWV
jgi:hypothetical protein